MAFNNIPEMFFSQAQKNRGNVAQRAKRGGRWIDITWEEMEQNVCEIAYGLLSLGMSKGDTVSLLSVSRAEWVQCDLGIQSAGGITVPIYQSNTPDQAEYIINNSASKFVIVENKMQLDKILSVRNKLQNVRNIIIVEGSNESKEGVLTFDELRKKGREQAKNFEKAVSDATASMKRDDIATIVYTSGTTGPPKGVIQTHGNHLAMSEALVKVTRNEKGDVSLLFLPLAHSFARAAEYYDIFMGQTTAFAESIEKVVDNLGEVKPHYMASVPRVFEKAYATILSNATATPIKKKIFEWAVKVGRQTSQLIQAKKPIPVGLRIKRAIAHKLVFSKIHTRFGGNLRFLVSGGAPLSKEIAEFFHAAGILILEGYGLTETCPATHMNRYEDYKFGTVGPALPLVDVKIAPDGEVLVKGPNICSRGYFKSPEETKELFTEDGWLRTGDIGEIDSRGFLKITDRKKDLIKTAGGKYVAPQNLENLLKVDPFISQAVVIGDRRPYCVALISISQPEAEKFAKENGISYSSYEDLTKNEKIFNRVKQTVDSMNSRLASFETIKKFFIVPRDFTQENDEMTPTLKIKRKVVTERYKEPIDKLYVK